ncbi:class I SAM-dependent methyltransferase [Mesorhizobium denitrificans]|uniref:Class I SAM-dependent methyltransferase n=2 Tax=Phyllobacteriaceae TaxID=69277 RepID=A0A371XGD8_9HYPH|nr:class I SAM-dependent methyltransferase [Mesorhizobium denitrificans]
MIRESAIRDLTINRFRMARGKILARQISRLREKLGRNITILDIGGRPDYWYNVNLDGVGVLHVLNNDPSELRRPVPSNVFEFASGDARDLSAYSDKSFDLVHSNSVIEHVGDWPDMFAMAKEARRVGSSGWVQTPAWEFPIEPHFQLPFVHWFSKPVRHKALSVWPCYRRLSLEEKRSHIDEINLVSYRQFSELFPNCEIFIERLLLAKSYVARWGVL